MGEVGEDGFFAVALGVIACVGRGEPASLP